MSQRFLVIQTAFLGDAVLASALLEKLHKHHPNAQLDLVVRKGNEGLFAGHPFLHNCWVWDKRKNKVLNLLRLAAQLRRQRYDQVINCQRFLSTGLLTLLARGGESTGYHKNPLAFFFTRRVPHVIGDGRHEVDRLGALVEHLTNKERPYPRLYPGAEERADVSRRLGAANHQPYVCMAPASVWYTKQWPEERWVDLLRLVGRDHRVFLIGSPGDRGLAERIAAAAGQGEVVAGELSLLATAALLQGATMTYANDSAPLHMAGAVGAPVTAIFCSTVPAFGFGPLLASGRVAQTNEALSCRPCGLHGHRACPRGHFRCAGSISAAQVVQAH
jgi:heptosyltransferase II